MKNKTCGECALFIPDVLSRCGILGVGLRIACNSACKSFIAKQEPPKPTLFDRITASPEVLAPEFVEMMYDRVAGDYRYYSMLTGEFYNSREEAFAATVEKLKEVCNG